MRELCRAHQDLELGKGFAEGPLHTTVPCIHHSDTYTWYPCRQGGSSLFLDRLCKSFIIRSKTTLHFSSQVSPSYRDRILKRCVSITVSIGTV